MYGQINSLRHTMSLLNVYGYTLQDLNINRKHLDSFSVQHTYMRLALEEARRALRVGEVPVGCVFVREGKIIAAGHNKTNATCNATRHAELVAYDKGFVAAGKNTKYLENSTLYVTVEPCIMCAAALNYVASKQWFLDAQ